MSHALDTLRARRVPRHRAALPVLLVALLLLLSEPDPAVALPRPRDGGAALSPGVAVWPLQPRPEVVQGYDAPGSRWGAGHRGVDLQGHVGQQVRAAAAGTVVFAGRIAGRGVVVVDHGATRTTYEPVAASVQVGDVVRAGEQIGRLALTGSHCFPAACLHWGLIEGHGAGDRYLDPLTLLGEGPVRLLPLVGGLPSLGAPAAVPPRLAGWHPSASDPAPHAVRQPVRPGALAGRAALFRG